MPGREDNYKGDKLPGGVYIYICRRVHLCGFPDTYNPSRVFTKPDTQICVAQ